MPFVERCVCFLPGLIGVVGHEYMGCIHGFVGVCLLGGTLSLAAGWAWGRGAVAA